MVPNQPLTFAGETHGRHEDAPHRLHLDKSRVLGPAFGRGALPRQRRLAAVRYYTITDFCASDAGGKIKVEQFVISGASKRGVDAPGHLLLLLDKRVIAIIRIVIDMLNVVPRSSITSRRTSFWAPAVADDTAT